LHTLIYSEIHINMTNSPDNNKPEYEYVNNYDLAHKYSGHALSPYLFDDYGDCNMGKIKSQHEYETFYAF
jgi:hypothetical protein